MFNVPRFLYNSALFIVVRRIVIFVLGQRDIATADDKDHGHIFVCSILEQSTLRPPEVYIYVHVPYICMAPVGVNNMHSMHVGLK